MTSYRIIADGTSIDRVFDSMTAATLWALRYVDGIAIEWHVVPVLCQ